jgi:hypothetical protein
MSTNSLKNRNDISYIKFFEYIDAIKDKEPLEKNAITLEFFGVDLIEFGNVLKREKNHVFKYKLKDKFKTAGQFIDVDTYLTRKEIGNFFKLAIQKKWYQFGGIDVNKVGLQDGEYIVGFFLTLQEK